MHEVLLQMTGLILSGVAWRWLKPGGLDAEITRRVLTGTVYYIFLPALVLNVLWQTELGLDSIRIALVAATCVVATLAGMWLGYRWRGTPRAAAGALILAAAFPNATYLGLPVLEKIFGPWARSVAIQFDLFACTPLLLTLGILTARRHGEAEAPFRPLTTLIRVPPLWAALAAVILNLGGIPLPGLVGGWLQLLAAAVVPLMLFSLGLALIWEPAQWQRWPWLVPVVVVQLGAMPALAWALAVSFGLEGGWLAAVVMEAAMPSMVLGVVLCDRFRLDTALYATTVTLTTALSLLTLPLWFHWLTAN